MASGWDGDMAVMNISWPQEGTIAGRTVKRLDRDQANVVDLYRQIQWAAPEPAPSIAVPEGAGATAVASKPAL